jgi:WD40 repeat protein
LNLGRNRRSAATRFFPDGRWVAACTWHGADGTKVWNATSGELAASLGGGDASAAFSPDGRWLVTGTEADYRIWETGTWRQGWRLLRDRATALGPLDCRSSGRVLAIASSSNPVRLIDPGFGATLAELAPPDPTRVASICFGGDDRYLAVANAGQGINLWDLELVQKQLAAMGLGW